MVLNNQQLRNILIGCSFLSTGGGGKYDLAKKTLDKINQPVILSSIQDINEDDLIVTAFMVGSLNKKGDLGGGVAASLELLEKVLQRDINYLIPVEIGPTSVMNILKLASKLKKPVIDGDFVGYRAAPEIYVESITLKHINRLPMAAVNLEGDKLVLFDTSTIEKIETVLRTFSAQSRSEVYVAGYPVVKSQIESVFGERSISFAEEVGAILNSSEKNVKVIEPLGTKGILFIDSGTIISQKDKDEGGFTTGELKIRSKQNTYEIIYKNENLVLLKNRALLYTSPDSILLLDHGEMRGITNSEKNIGKKVSIFMMKATKAWRTIEGKKLFSPKMLGLPYQQRLLK